MSTQAELISTDSYDGTCGVCGRELVRSHELDGQLTRVQIHRRHRRQHYDWSGIGEYDPDNDPYLSRNHGPDHEELDDDCRMDTQTYEITFHDEYVETVRVEAANKGEAKEIAELERTHDGELIETIHTERRAVSEKSQASIEYLEDIGLLPEDHDVTPSDIKELVDND